jgi:hypothetical protein
LKLGVLEAPGEAGEVKRQLDQPQCLGHVSVK